MGNKTHFMKPFMLYKIYNVPYEITYLIQCNTWWNLTYLINTLYEMKVNEYTDFLK